MNIEAVALSGCACLALWYTWSVLLVQRCPLCHSRQSHVETHRSLAGGESSREPFIVCEKVHVCECGHHGRVLRRRKESIEENRERFITLYAAEDKAGDAARRLLRRSGVVLTVLPWDRKSHDAQVAPAASHNGEIYQGINGVAYLCEHVPGRSRASHD